MAHTTCNCLLVALILGLIVVFFCCPKKASTEGFFASFSSPVYYNPLKVSSSLLKGPNQYLESCGPCITTDEDSNLSQQKCVTYNSQKYPLLGYTMNKTCIKCDENSPTYGQKSCQRTYNPGNIYSGTYNVPMGASVCGI